MTEQDDTGVWARASQARGPAPDPDVAREEAERLVAAGFAAVSMVADRVGAPTRERGGAAAAGYDALGDVLFGPSGHRRHSVANDSAECCQCPVCRVIAAAREPDPQLAERLATGVGNLAEGAARALRTIAGAAGSVAAGRPGFGSVSAPAPEADPWAAATAQPPPASAVTPAKKAVAKKAVAKKTVTKKAALKKTAKKTVAKKTAAGGAAE